MKSSIALNGLIGRRVAVIGCSGSGKSTFAKQLAKARGLSYINSDELFWMPDWVQRPEAEFHLLLADNIAQDGWVLDGNIGRRAPVVLPRIDMLIWLDYPRPFVMRRLLAETRFCSTPGVLTANAEPIMKSSDRRLMPRSSSTLSARRKTSMRCLPRR